MLPSDELHEAPHRSRVAFAGMAIARQRPATANGIVFMLLEDELGQVNLIVPPEVYERHRAIVRGEPLLLVRGRFERIEREPEHRRLDTLESLGPLARRLASSDVGAALPARPPFRASLTTWPWQSPMPVVLSDGAFLRSKLTKEGEESCGSPSLVLLTMLVSVLGAASPGLGGGAPDPVAAVVPAPTADLDGNGIFDDLEARLAGKQRGRARSVVVLTQAPSHLGAAACARVGRRRVPPTHRFSVTSRASPRC